MKTRTTQTLIPSVNYHLWEPCNFNCKFCFASFKDVKRSVLPKGHLTKAESLAIIDRLADHGFSKITFAGGEPSLCPWIGDLIVRAKIRKMTTMMVTNGSKLDGHFIGDTEGFLDWIVLSIDSLDPRVNSSIGRTLGSKCIPDEDFYLEKVALVKSSGIRLKINTVVNRRNFNDYSMKSFIYHTLPERWKVLQVLKVIGQNDHLFDEFAITEEQFLYYLYINEVRSFSGSVIERNTDMQGTYIMVDPAGRFFDNTKGYYTYSEPILTVGVNRALEQISYDFDGFVDRGGLYL